MNPRDFLNVADALIASDSEADWRTAGSRAYYAAFHVARNLLRQCGFVVPKADQAHAYLWLRLANCGHPDVTKAGDDLHDLRNVRNQADYDLEMLFPHAKAVHFDLLAEDVIRMFELAVTEPTLQSRITDGMRDYERAVLKEVTWRP